MGRLLSQVLPPPRTDAQRRALARVRASENRVDKIMGLIVLPLMAVGLVLLIALAVSVCG